MSTATGMKAMRFNVLFLYRARKNSKKIKKFFFRQTRAFHSSPRFACRQQTEMSAASLQALPAPLRPTDDDWAKMLAAHVHLGTKNLDNKMVRSYVLSLFRRTPRMCTWHDALQLWAGTC